MAYNLEEDDGVRSVLNGRHLAVLKLEGALNKGRKVRIVLNSPGLRTDDYFVRHRELLRYFRGILAGSERLADSLSARLSCLWRKPWRTPTLALLGLSYRHLADLYLLKLRSMG